MLNFVVIGRHGSGTKVFQRYLNNHNRIECFDELFMEKHDYSDYKNYCEQNDIPVYNYYYEKFGLDNDDSIENYLESFYLKASKSDSRGFLMHYNDYSDRIAEFINKADARVFHVQRDKTDIALEKLLQESDKNELEADLKPVDDKINDMVGFNKDVEEAFDNVYDIYFSRLKPKKESNEIYKNTQKTVRKALEVKHDVMRLEDKPDYHWDLKDKITNYKHVQRHSDE